MSYIHMYTYTYYIYIYIWSPPPQPHSNKTNERVIRFGFDSVVRCGTRLEELLAFLLRGPIPNAILLCRHC